MKFKILISILFCAFSNNYIFSQENIADFLPLKNENILFYENFDNNDNNWFAGSENNMFSSISKGYLSFGNFSNTGSLAQWRTFYLNSENDFNIEVSVKQNSGLTQNQFGIIWGATGWDNLYCFNIVSNGYYNIFKIEDGEYKEIKKLKQVTSILPKYYFNKLNILYKNDTSYFFINDSLVFQKKNLKMFGPQMGIFIDGKTEIKVDYLKIIHPEYNKNITGYPITVSKIEKLDIKTANEIEIKNLFYQSNQKKMYFTALNSEKKANVYYSKKDNNDEFTDLKLLDTIFDSKTENYVINYFEKDKSFIFYNITIFNSISYNKILYSKLDSLWSEPNEIIIENLTNIPKKTDFFITNDKKIMLLNTINSDCYGNNDIYYSYLTEKGYYSEPLNIGNIVNSYSNEGSVFLYSDNKTLFFSSNSLPGFGGYDIFVTQRLDDTWSNWSEPQNLGPIINTSANETYFYIDDENKYGYFISDIEGFTNVYSFLVFNVFFKNLNSN